MPKNVKGGNKAKRMANKHSMADVVEKFREKGQDPDEAYAVVTKVCGNNIVDVCCDDGVIRKCVIHKRFRGRNKHDNRVEIGGILLVGVRSWEIRPEGKAQKCDLLHVYSPQFHDRVRRADDCHQTYYSHAKNSIGGESGGGGSGVAGGGGAAGGFEFDYGIQEGADSSGEDVDIDDI